MLRLRDVVGKRRQCVLCQVARDPICLASYKRKCCMVPLGRPFSVMVLHRGVLCWHKPSRSSSPPTTDGVTRGWCWDGSTL